jgi:hypothetical protein
MRRLLSKKGGYLYISIKIFEFTSHVEANPFPSRSNALFQTQMALVSGAIRVVLNAHFNERTHGRSGVTGQNSSSSSIM